MVNAFITESGQPAVPFELNRELRLAGLASSFRERHRLRIPDLLESAGALMLYQHLSRDVQWTTFLVADGTVYGAAAGDPRTHTTDVEREMLARAHKGAQSGFACLYDANRLFPEDAPEGAQIDFAADTPVLEQLCNFVNSESFLHLFRTTTGVPEIVKADIHATRFRPGHFTTFHTALPYSPRAGNRLVAFELNLTIEWKPEWGGLHQFEWLDDVAEACVPSFNVLDIFSIDRGRWISNVTPFSEGERLAISGWLYGA